MLNRVQTCLQGALYLSQFSYNVYKPVTRETCTRSSLGYTMYRPVTEEPCTYPSLSHQAARYMSQFKVQHVETYH